MRSRLFSRDIPPACQYCKYGFLTSNAGSVLCEKHGVTYPGSSCRKYVYAPLKRIPRRQNALPKYDPSDFSL